jgi:hypothetical protein
MFVKLAEGVGFEPTVGLPQRLISSQVPLTTQPPFQPFIIKYLQQTSARTILHCIPALCPVAYGPMPADRTAKRAVGNERNTCLKIASGARYQGCRICLSKPATAIIMA